jgi:Protein of unknown function (DUF3363)
MTAPSTAAGWSAPEGSRTLQCPLSLRGLTQAAEKLSDELAMPHSPPMEGMRLTGRHARTVDLPDRRLAVIKGRDEFALVPWRGDLAHLRGRDIAIAIRDRAITLSIARARERDLTSNKLEFAAGAGSLRGSSPCAPG